MSAVDAVLMRWLGSELVRLPAPPRAPHFATETVRPGRLAGVAMLVLNACNGSQVYDVEARDHMARAPSELVAACEEDDEIEGGECVADGKAFPGAPLGNAWRCNATGNAWIEIVARAHCRGDR